MNAQKTFISRNCIWLFLIVLMAFAGSTISSFAAASFRLGSVTYPGLGTSGGGGDSWATVVSKDGRYILFASSANNLVLGSNNVPLQPISPAAQNVYLHDRQAGTTILVSVNKAGTGGGNGDSFPVDISSNGQFVLFESYATNLTSGTTNLGYNIFVRDLFHGSNILVSVNTNGIGGNGLSRSSVMTPDGHFVSFVSEATDLVTGDTNNIPDVFVRDMQAGTTTLVSLGATGVSGNASELPDITPDGRYVAFYSSASNLVAGVTNKGEIYVRDMTLGATTWVSAAAHTAVKTQFNTTNCISFNQTISDDGQYIAYEAASNSASGPFAIGLVLRYGMVSGLTDTVGTNAASVQLGSEVSSHTLDMTPDGRFVAYSGRVGTAGTTTFINLWDSQSNATYLVSGDYVSNSIPTNSLCTWPIMDVTGRYVVFLSSATNVVSNIVSGAGGNLSVGANFHIYLRDTQAGVTQLVDVDTNGVGSLSNLFAVPRMSTNGMVVAFEALDDSLVGGDNNNSFDVFVRDIANQDTELISAHHPDLTGLTPNGRCTISTASVSSNGRYIAFSSDASNLASNDTNGCRDVFVRDLLMASNTLVSIDTSGANPGNNFSMDPAISADGRYVAFMSSASNLVSGDNNSARDVFVRDLQLGVTTLVSTNRTGTGPGNADSYLPSISADGRYVLFRSKANNLTTGISSTGDENLYWRDLQSGLTRVLTTNTASDTPVFAAMTPDGRYVAFGIAGKPLLVWDNQLPGPIYTNSLTSAAAVGISPDGTHVGFLVMGTTNHVYAADVVANTTNTLGIPHSAFNFGLRFSGDSRFMAYTATDATGTNQVYVYDFQSGSNVLVSHKLNFNFTSGNDNSDSPDISSDGRFVAYRSASTNLVAGVTNGIPHIYLYDRFSNATALITSSVNGNFPSDGRSLTPVFSSDAQTLVFESWADDLVVQDFNQSSDIYALGLYGTNSQPAFSAGIVLVGPAGAGPTISWSVTPGRNYQVQFKNSLSDSVWQPLNASVNINGSQASVNDSPAAQRYYRIVSF